MHTCWLNSFSKRKVANITHQTDIEIYRSTYRCDIFRSFYLVANRSIWLRGKVHLFLLPSDIHSLIVGFNLLCLRLCLTLCPCGQLSYLGPSVFMCVTVLPALVAWIHFWCNEKGSHHCYLFVAEHLQRGSIVWTCTHLTNNLTYLHSHCLPFSPIRPLSLSCVWESGVGVRLVTPPPSLSVREAKQPASQSTNHATS